MRRRLPTPNATGVQRCRDVHRPDVMRFDVRNPPDTFVDVRTQITPDLTPRTPENRMGRLTSFLEQWSTEPKAQNARLIRRGQAVGKLSRAFDAEAIARTMIAMFQALDPVAGFVVFERFPRFISVQSGRRSARNSRKLRCTPVG
jgi:hypothetical protein